MKKIFAMVILIAISLGACGSPVPAPTAVPPTSTATPFPFPEEWKGTFTYVGSEGFSMIVYIDDVTGTTFTGRTAYPSFGDTYEMEGYFVDDFGDEAQQIKWSHFENFKSGDKSGPWLKFTETKVLVDRSGSTSLRHPFYAHIREDGVMIGFCFENDLPSTTEPLGEFEIALVP